MYLCPSVVHQLHRPPSFVLDPNKNASFHIAGGQLLKGFVPSHQDNLQTSRAASHFAETLQLALHNVKIMLFSLSKECSNTAVIQFCYQDHQSFLSVCFVSVTHCCRSYHKSISFGHKESKIGRRWQHSTKHVHHTSLLCPRRLKFILWGVVLSLLQ